VTTEPNAFLDAVTDSAPVEPWTAHRVTRHFRLLVALVSVLPVVPLLVRRPTIWYDEGYTFFYAHVPLGSFARSLWDLDLYTAGFYVVERVGVAVFGDGTLGLRMVPALFAIASVAMFAVVLRRRGVRPTPTIVVTSLFAASPAMAAHAGNGRGYSMVTFWYLLCLYVCLSPARLTVRRSVGIGLLLGVGLYVHASLLVGLPLLALVLVRRHGLRATLRPLALGAVLSVPLGLQLATHTVNGVGSGLTAGQITGRRLASIAWRFTRHPVLLVVLVVASGVLIVVTARRRSVGWSDPDGTWIELGGLVLPVAAAIVATPVVSLWTWSYLWIAGVGLFVASARGIDLVAESFRQRVHVSRSVRLAIAAVVIGTLVGANVERDFSNDDLQAAYGQLLVRTRPGDVVVAPLLADALAMRYQAELHQVQPSASMVYVFDDWHEPMREEQLREISNNEITRISAEVAGRPVWFVHWDATLPVRNRVVNGAHLARELMPDYCFRSSWTGDNVVLLHGTVETTCPDEAAGGGAGG
jgi:hypothetical protein